MTIDTEMVFEDTTECVIFKVIDQDGEASLTKVLNICIHKNVGNILLEMLACNEITNEDISNGSVCYTTKACFAENSVKLN